MRAIASAKKGDPAAGRRRNPPILSTEEDDSFHAELRKSYLLQLTIILSGEWAHPQLRIPARCKATARASRALAQSTEQPCSLRLCLAGKQFLIEQFNHFLRRRHGRC